MPSASLCIRIIELKIRRRRETNRKKEKKRRNLEETYPNEDEYHKCLHSIHYSFAIGRLTNICICTYDGKQRRYETRNGHKRFQLNKKSDDCFMDLRNLGSIGLRNKIREPLVVDEMPMKNKNPFNTTKGIRFIWIEFHSVWSGAKMFMNGYV